MMEKFNHLGMEAYGDVAHVFRAIRDRADYIQSGYVSPEEALQLRFERHNSFI